MIGGGKKKKKEKERWGLCICPLSKSDGLQNFSLLN
jgi:hypothetical protein